MANYLFLLVVACLSALLSSATAQSSHENCFVCETVVNVAKHEKPKTTKELEKLLEKECEAIADFFHDTKECLKIFKNNTNLQTVWNLLQNDTHSRSICAAINQCPTSLRQSTKSEEPGTPIEKRHEYCFVCEMNINAVKYEKPSNITELQKMLEKECKKLDDFFHDTKECLKIFKNDTNVQLVWNLLQNGTHARSICAALDQCPANLRKARSAGSEELDTPIEKPHEYCFVCETIVNVAKHEKPSSPKELEKLLEKECKAIADFFHDTKKCLEVFRNGTNLQIIWNLLQNDTHSRAICAAIDVCDRQLEEATKQKVNAALCAQCKSATHDFKHLSKTGLSEELLGLCSAAADNDCSGTALVELDMLYDFYQAVDNSNIACYHLNLC